MVSPTTIAITCVYLAVKYGILVAPGGRPSLTKVCITIPPIAVAVCLLISADDPWYDTSLLVAASLPLALPSLIPCHVGVLATILIGARGFKTGNVSIAIIALAAAAICSGFIAFTARSANR